MTTTRCAITSSSTRYQRHKRTIPRASAWYLVLGTVFFFLRDTLCSQHRKKGLKTAAGTTTLKVVGASWQKTRVGTYILSGAGLLVIGAFFISHMERPKYNGTYCATALWTKNVGFQIEYWKQQNDLLNIPKGAARICYKDSIYENGWAQIEVETQRTYPDFVQAYGAGILEGSLTWNNIYNQWRNTIESSCERDEISKNFCSWLRQLLTENYVKIKAMAEELGEHDHYWYQIGLYYNQLEGLETGYQRGAKRARSDLEEEIPFADLLLMNAAADIHDLKIYFENFVLTSNETGSDSAGDRNFFLPSATMLTRIFRTEDSPSWQLLFGHSTAASYSSMLRIQKRYKFHYHFSPNQRTNTVPGVDITFTGYPGILGSTDDFYIIKGRQVQSIVAGVGIKNENFDLWHSVDVRESVPLAARVMSANRIAQNRRTWAKAMSRHPSTGSKQWITIDLNKFNVPDVNVALQQPSANEDHLQPSSVVVGGAEGGDRSLRRAHKGGVWIVEQLPGRFHSKDVSDEFLGEVNSTWVANGVAYFDEMLKASGVSQDEFASKMAPSDEADLWNLEAVDKYLRRHGFRGDLLGDASVAYGNIDIKLFSYNARLGMSDYHAFAGPIFMRLQRLHAPSTVTVFEGSAPVVSAAAPDATVSALGDERLNVVIDDAAELAELEMIAERRPVRNDIRAIKLRQIGNEPFQWSKAAQYMETGEHEGHPDWWYFDKVAPKWAW